ncbi:MAG TPA: MBL fold metallo-hydrolase [Cytophagaceae bacterium]|jgi:glyoxylase-like metal-dependent hydrolase (beta-lactamase superfamily II)/rhodanese-related sulfurtransferase
MIIEQFHDQGLAHLSYAILSQGEIAVIDPCRNPQQYYAFAEKHHAKIIAVIETHPHADFVSGHGEMSEKGIEIYVSKLTGAKYHHKTFNEGDMLKIGEVTLIPLDTPGHSPDGISILLKNKDGRNYAIFTGDTLFIGDVGRPDLRESAGNATAKKESLARQLFHSLRDKFITLEDDVIVYPAHGPGSLCGKSMSTELSGTIGQQKKENYALQEMGEEEFVKIILDNQPLIPKYFSYDVDLNISGAPSIEEGIKNVKIISSMKDAVEETFVIDTRAAKEFREGHLKGAINLQDGKKFETWLGSIVAPEERYSIIASDNIQLLNIIEKTTKIGYEMNVGWAIAQSRFDGNPLDHLDLANFETNTSLYTILDVREKSEVKEGKIFGESINIPLSELRERISEVPQSKPIVVHCAAGYRSAAAVSILDGKVGNKVYDLSDDIEKFI